MQMDINCDMGESFGAYELGMDKEIMKFISSANVACGWHAGDPMVMERTVLLAKENNVSVGAHPGYPDLMGFGRRFMDCTPNEIKNYVIYQIGALWAFCKANGIQLSHVKPHGALYLRSVEDEFLARAVAEAVASVDKDLIFVALAGEKGKKVRKIAEELGLKVACEAFPDRAYTREGNLAPRKMPGAVIHDPSLVAERALMMAQEKKVVAIDGSVIEIEVHTLCVHGDNPKALEEVKEIRNTLEQHGVQIKKMKEVLKG
jgi:UPF0271 protein